MYLPKFQGYSGYGQTTDSSYGQNYGGYSNYGQSQSGWTGLLNLLLSNLKKSEPLLSGISIQSLGYSQSYGGYENQKQSSYGQQSYNNQGQQNTESSGG